MIHKVDILEDGFSIMGNGINKIYLIPTPISEETFETTPASIASIIENLRCFIVEEEAPAQRFLKKLNPQLPINECQFFALNEHTPPREIENIFKETQNKDAGVISQAGCPCVADPGSEFILLAHKHNREIIPLTGPSSIVLALMASGLNGQNFAFHGYLPKDKDARLKKIKALEERSLKENQTQIFMEAPYRNQNLFEDILSCCAAQTLLCVAVDLTGPAQYIKTLPVKNWSKTNPPLHKKPALFLMLR